MLMEDENVSGCGEGGADMLLVWEEQEAWHRVHIVDDIDNVDIIDTTHLIIRQVHGLGAVELVQPGEAVAQPGRLLQHPGRLGHAGGLLVFLVLVLQTGTTVRLVLKYP